MTSARWHVGFVGDSAMVVRTQAASPHDANALVHRLAEAVRAAAITGVRDVVPGMRDLVIHLDPSRSDVTLLERTLVSAGEGEPARQASGVIVDVPVRFGGDAGPDLEDVARSCELSTGEVVQRFLSSTYVVHFVGFLPGFPYLGPVDAALRLPRRTTPRPRVPAGSVAIAGEYAGIYPWESPGGWHLIGRTEATLFDPWREPPALLAPGTRVRFIDRHA